MRRYRMLNISEQRNISAQPRRGDDFKPHYLQQFYYVSKRDAAKHAGVSIITIYRNYKRYNIKWPYYKTAPPILRSKL
ncbi:hypothetical protein PC116_g11064 [Phytophthora cactorum]|uniref:Uncharacterized protein n=1 Tax=Phytophthora cactorum TaxID=29920 RepID=A0A8T0ZD96_9STRA|nr:hypothetical protein PC113_g8252 [Phytophthora cactorum]KAG2913843.1 hypothetical protein PC114_g8435 [Phytophthora cactorum]KAG2945533.1 hypothetical protein PC117_g8381 [Phytophthora cactorum]KAG3024469.1 hypothetical protein PC120_g7027 [Phytophthora cactorum]KAG3025999.1 hypothetical protein PC119_g7987 [Phytophthora cactorum]